MSTSKITVLTTYKTTSFGTPLTGVVDVIEKIHVQHVSNAATQINANSPNHKLNRTHPPKNGVDDSKSRSVKPGSRDYLQQRIHRLESLVTDLAAQVRHNAHSPPTSTTESSQSPEQRNPDHPSPDTSSQTSPVNSNPLDPTADVKEEPIDDLRIAMGDLKVSNGKVMYTSGNSWNTILDEIADIKLAMNPVYSSYHTTTLSAPLLPSSFPFFASSPPAVTELVALLPSRADTELLVHKFIHNMHTMCPCLHKPSFMKDLSDFYAAPDSADAIFLGTLFAVLACAISISTEEDGTAGPWGTVLMQKGVATRKEMATVWRDASMQAFCMGGFLTNTSLQNLQVL